jgi:hypothetical protein
MNRYRQNNREQLKEECLNYLGGKICAKCGNRQLPICCYEFHHNKGNKEMEISKIIQQQKKFDIIKKELDKCIILCANCHKEAHHFNTKITYGEQ